MASKKDISDDIKDMARELDELSTGSIKANLDSAKKEVKKAASAAKNAAKSTGAAASKAAKLAAEKVKNTNAEEVKETTKKTVEKAGAKAKDVAEKAKAAAEKTGAKAKETVEKAAGKVASAAAKSEIKRTAVVEYAGNQYMVDDVIARCEAKYKADNKRKSYKDIKVYIKPENNAAYYVVDNKSADKIDLIE